MPPLTWLVTGCSSGFGEALVYAVLDRGDFVIATGRNAEERLTHLKDVGAGIMTIDVTLPKEVLDQRIQDAIELYGNIDVLVNNAGFGISGFMEDASTDSWYAQFNTNFFGSVNMTRAMLPHFRQKRSGKVVFIGSCLGWGPSMGGGLYAASKFALEGFAETVALETAAFGIKSIIFEPGAFRTAIWSPQNLQWLPNTQTDYAEASKRVKDFKLSLAGNQRGDVKKAAERIIDVIKGEGMAKGREMPTRLPLGPDAAAHIKKKCLDTLEILGSWGDIVCSTDISSGSEKRREPLGLL